ncbi:MAG: hypothetical protein JXR96_00120 [Deltaproteobacteria bacterium]|nr:hypothetical protein [Deltaproteobacteria bacterium]
MAELARSAEIDWAEVEGCYGETGDFHRYLRGLVSDEPRVQSHAVSRLYSECLHQGSVYETTAKVMPFLIALLEHPQAKPSELLEMIHDFATNAAPWVAEARRAREEGLDEDEEDWTFPILGTVEAVGQHWPKLWKLMGSEDEKIRQTVLSMASIPPRSPAISDSVIAFADDRGQPLGMRACAVEALSSMDGAKPEDLLPYLEDDSALVQATAAIELGITFGPDSPAEAVAALARALERRDELADDYHGLPFVETHFLARLALAIGWIGLSGSEAARALVNPLCELIEEVDGASATTYGKGLLALSLGRCERPFAPDFLRVLETLAESRSFNVFNVNAAEVLEKWNLPRYKEELGPFVRELQKEADPEAALYAYIHRDDEADGG